MSSSTSFEKSSKSSRNRPKNRRGGGGNRSGGGGGRSRKPVKEPSLGEKVLSTITFGLVGKSKPPEKPAGKKSKKSAKPSGKSAKSGPPKKGGQRKPKQKKAKRTPEIVEVTSGRLYVGNLDYDATESDLFELFNGVGQVQNAEIVCHRYTQRSKGYAFVEMGSIEEAKRAVDVLHDKDFMGRKLWVSGAKSSGPKN